MLKYSFDKFIVNVLTLPVGPLKTNCYVLDLNKHFLVVDPGMDGPKIVDHLRKNQNKHGGKVDIYLTHGHYDHISGVPDVSKAYPEAKIFCSKGDSSLYFDPQYNLSQRATSTVSLKDFEKNMVFVNETSKLKFGDVDFEVLDLPGHTPGGTGLYCRKGGFIFTGDTLFRGTVGNTSFPLGDREVLMKSINNKLMTLPDETTILCGHGDVSTIGDEKLINKMIHHWA